MLNVVFERKWKRVYINGQQVDIWTSQDVQTIDIAFDWGNRSASTHQLALGILYMLTGDKDFAKQHGEALMNEYLSKVDTSQDVVAWSKLDEWVVNHGGVLKQRYNTDMV